jgi:hypothetical protein
VIRTGKRAWEAGEEGAEAASAGVTGRRANREKRKVKTSESEDLFPGGVRGKEVKWVEQ